MTSEADVSNREAAARDRFDAAVSQAQAGEVAAAILAFGRIVEDFSESLSLAIQATVADALLAKAGLLFHKNDFDEALVVLDDLLARFGADDRPELVERVAWALFNKAMTLRAAERSDDSLVVLDALIRRYPTRQPATDTFVAAGFAEKASILVGLGSIAEAVGVYVTLMSIYGGSKSPNTDHVSLERSLARALIDDGLAKSEAGSPADALAAYDKTIELFSNATDEELRVRLAWALYDRAVVLGEIGRDADARRTCEDIVARFADAEETALRERVAAARLTRAFLLAQSERTEDAIAAYADVAADYRADSESQLREKALAALVGKGALLWELGRDGDAVVAYDDALRSGSGAGTPVARGHLAHALLYKATSLVRLGDANAARSALNEIVARFARDDDPSVREAVAEARAELASDRYR